MARNDLFDPIAVLQALDARSVRYVVVGALGRVILGSDEITDGIDIVPSPREENLRRLAVALDDLEARRPDGKSVDLDGDLTSGQALELRSEAGEVKVVLEPAGTQGYDDLRRSATREPLGRGVRPMVASLGDHARMLSALDREHDQEALRTVRRLIELERARLRDRSRGLSLER
jgi:hypothetical protein